MSERPARLVRMRLSLELAACGQLRAIAARGDHLVLARI
jgi:hypothetical protein